MNCIIKNCKLKITLVMDLMHVKMIFSGALDINLTTLKYIVSYCLIQTFEPPHGKTNNLHGRKQRRRSASQ